VISLVLGALLVPQTAPNWGIDAGKRLIWAGEPFVPIGARITADPSAVEGASQAGVRDLLVEMPGGFSHWVPTLEALAKSPGTYMLQSNGMAPAGSGYIIEPESYRLIDVSGTTKLRATIPSAKHVLVVVASQRDGTVRSTTVVETPAGELDTTVNPNNPGEHVALIYPLVSDLRIPDAWAGLDDLRDTFLAESARWPKMPGLRGIVNPIGALPHFPDGTSRVVPTSKRFQIEFAESLRERYTSVPRLELAWTLPSGQIKTFEAAARLVPLWSERRGVPILWDPQTNLTYKVDRRQSTAWKDIQDSYLGSLRRRYSNVVNRFSEALGVPVFQDWNGWNGPYASESAQLTGLGIRLETGSYQSMLEGAARALSSMRRWNNPGVLIATDIGLPTEGDANQTITTAIGASAELGVRGWYLRANSAEALKFVADLSNAKSSLLPSTNSLPQYLLFPEAAHNPAFPMKIQPGLFWLPSPESGSRIDYGRLFSGYQYSGREGTFYALWSNGPKRKVKLMVPNPKEVKLKLASGPAITPKVNKDHLVFELGTEPVLITEAKDVPVPDEAATETMAEFAEIEKMIPKEMRTMVDEAVFFRQAAQSYKNSPSISFGQMRVQLRRLKRTAAPVNWIEGEQSRTSTFSDVQPVTGASGGEAMALLTRITPTDGFFRASWAIAPRREGLQNLWVSVKGSGISDLIAETLDQELRATSLGVSPYGDGFAWYNFGKLNLPARQIELQLRVQAPFQGQLWIDALMIAPDGVTPSGIDIPWWAVAQKP